ncbi:MAG: aminotransferase class I/II-fold pyridoxal phosphate-dependent enzyme [Candidatus Moranbacteria bacterium]|nr:aminotransferase class I/II-fold pyridoxal phosphate-dependent enzyme [Candidatus Moranbacteria bacterium]
MSNDNFYERFENFQSDVNQKNALGGVFSVTGSSLGAEVSINIDGNTMPVTSYMSLDYLGMGQEPAVIENCIRNIRSLGTGFASSRTVMESSQHQALENALADFKRMKSCLLVNTGYLANVILPQLIFDDVIVTGGYKLRRPRKKTVVCMDRLTHASLLSTLATMKGKRVVDNVKKYDHLDYDSLQSMLDEYKSDDVQKFIFTDSLFSMGGDFANVRLLLDFAKHYDAILVIDNAHADGVYGAEGRGYLEAQGITSQDDLKYIIQTGTLSKAICALGGHITFPSSSPVDLAKFSQWEFIFSVAIPTFLAATCVHSIRLIRGDMGDKKREQLHILSAILRSRLQERGFNILRSTSHIIPIVIGTADTCLAVHDYLLREHRIWIGPIRWPAVSENGALLRCAVTANHSEENIGELIEALEKARNQFSF